VLKKGKLSLSKRAQKNGFDGQSLDDGVLVLRKRTAKPVKHKGSKKTEEEFGGSSGLFCVFVLKKGKLNLLNTKD